MCSAGLVLAVVLGVIVAAVVVDLGDEARVRVGVVLDRSDVAAGLVDLVLAVHLVT